MPIHSGFGDIQPGTYLGEWKINGYGSTHQTFRDGSVQLKSEENRWYLLLRYQADPSRIIKSYQLKTNIKQVLNRSRLVLDIKNGDSISFKGDQTARDILAKKLIMIMENKGTMWKAGRTSVSPSSTSSAISIPRQTPGKAMALSPTEDAEDLENFTGVKVRPGRSRSLSPSSSPDEELPSPKSESKISRNSFLEMADQKSAETLRKSTSSFYGSSAPSGSFKFNSLRKPGLLPDPKSRSASKLLSPTYSWGQKTPSSSTSYHSSSKLQGFSNLGNTCYMNAILQSLYGLDMFTTDLITASDKITKQLHSDDKKSCLFRVLHDLFMAKKSTSNNNEQKRQLLSEVKKNISSSAKRFSGFDQHDAHEFLGQILDQLKDEMEKINKQLSVSAEESLVNNNDSHGVRIAENNPTASNFEFKITHTITCSECSNAVNNLETFNDMSVDIPPARALENTLSIQDALDLTFLPETVEYTCEKCQGKEAKVHHKFTQLPRVLIIHLKRYHYNTVTSRNTKLAQSLIIPRYLTLQAQCTECTSPHIPAPEPAKELLNCIKFNPLQTSNMNRNTEPKNNTPKRRLNMDSEDSKREKTLLQEVVNDGNKMATDQKKPQIVKEAYNPPKMSEEEMIKLAMERSMIDMGTPGKHVTFTEESFTESPGKSPAGETLEQQSPSMFHKDEIMTLTSPITNKLLSAEHLHNGIDGPKSSSPKPDHTYSQDTIHVNGGVLNLEPPHKRTKLNECDSAYNSFTEIEDRTCKSESIKQELNSSGIDMNISDEENKENYTPPTGPAIPLPMATVTQEPGVEPIKVEDEEVKLMPEEGYDEEAQLKLAIENSLKDMENMGIQQDLDDDLEKAKQLSLNDVEGDSSSFVITPHKAKDKQDLKRTKKEEDELKVHAEGGGLPYSYQLVSIVSHIGQSSAAGHYISDTYDMNRRLWCSWNDSHGQRIDWEKLQRDRERTGYLFFYTAKDVVEDIENHYWQRRGRARSLSLGALPGNNRLIPDQGDKPASAIKLKFTSRQEIR